jgi:hypothetical protein
MNEEHGEMFASSEYKRESWSVQVLEGEVMTEMNVIALVI